MFSSSSCYWLLVVTRFKCFPLSAVLTTRTASDNNAVAVKCPFALWTTNKSHCKVFRKSDSPVPLHYSFNGEPNKISFPLLGSVAHTLPSKAPPKKTGLGAVFSGINQTEATSFQPFLLHDNGVLVPLILQTFENGLPEWNLIGSSFPTGRAKCPRKSRARTANNNGCVCAYDSDEFIKTSR